MIKEVETEEQDPHMTGDDFGQAAAGMQINNISSEEMEDGELAEEPESAQAYPSGNSSERKERQANASTVADQQESQMPNAVVNDGEIFEFHSVINVTGKLNYF